MEEVKPDSICINSGDSREIVQNQTQKAESLTVRENLFRCPKITNQPEILVCSTKKCAKQLS